MTTTAGLDDGALGVKVLALRLKRPAALEGAEEEGPDLCDRVVRIKGTLMSIVYPTRCHVSSRSFIGAGIAASNEQPGRTLPPDKCSQYTHMRENYGANFYPND